MPSVVGDPSECSFDDPSLWQQDEAANIIAALYNFDLAIEVSLCSIDEFSSIATVSPDQSESRK